jgi:hypothetical protein
MYWIFGLENIHRVKIMNDRLYDAVALLIVYIGMNPSEDFNRKYIDLLINDTDRFTVIIIKQIELKCRNDGIDHLKSVLTDKRLTYLFGLILNQNVDVKKMSVSMSRVFKFIENQNCKSVSCIELIKKLIS